MLDCIYVHSAYPHILCLGKCRDFSIPPETVCHICSSRYRYGLFTVYQKSRKRQWLNISDEAFARTTVLRPDSILLTDVAGEDISIRAIKSTDIGNAYLLRAEGKMVYHGGDLNWWNWESEGKAYCNNMTVHYHAAIEKLASAVRNEATDNNIAPEITAAMAPLDPRLGEGSEGLGIEYLLKNVTVQHIFPMHMWKQYEVIGRYIAAHPDEKGIIARITRDGQQFEI